jgi:thioredoxin-related protein
MPMFRFYLLIFIFLSNFALSQEFTLPPAKNFFADSQQVWKKQTPILIMFSIPNCGYCKTVKQEVIGPMSKMSEYKNKIIIRHINANSFDTIRNFYNQKISSNQFTSQLEINFFPTVLLVNQYGYILEKMVGVVNEDYYWTDLDKLINSATSKLNNKVTNKVTNKIRAKL